MELIFFVVGAALIGGIYGFMMVRAQQKDPNREDK